MCTVPSERLLGHLLSSCIFPHACPAAGGRTLSTKVLRWALRPSPGPRCSLWTSASALLTKGPSPLVCCPHLPFPSRPSSTPSFRKLPPPTTAPGGSPSTNPLITYSQGFLRTAMSPHQGQELSFPYWTKCTLRVGLSLPTRLRIPQSKGHVSLIRPWAEATSLHQTGVSENQDRLSMRRGTVGGEELYLPHQTRSFSKTRPVPPAQRCSPGRRR